MHMYACDIDVAMCSDVFIFTTSISHIYIYIYTFFSRRRKGNKYMFILGIFQRSSSVSKFASRPDEVNSIVDETLALTMDQDTEKTCKSLTVLLKRIPVKALRV